MVTTLQPKVYAFGYHGDKWKIVSHVRAQLGSEVPITDSDQYHTDGVMLVWHEAMWEFDKLIKGERPDNVVIHGPSRFTPYEWNMKPFAHRCDSYVRHAAMVIYELLGLLPRESWSWV